MWWPNARLSDFTLVFPFFWPLPRSLALTPIQIFITDPRRQRVTDIEQTVSNGARCCHESIYISLDVVINVNRCSQLSGSMTEDAMSIFAASISTPFRIPCGHRKLASFNKYIIQGGNRVVEMEVKINK